MIDSRVKGRTAELKARDELRKLTGLNWERTPLSGALNAKHMMKGDLYVPQTALKYCVEVKHYAEEHINTKILTGKNPMFFQWWEQTLRESNQMGNDPLLIFKYNRSKWFVAFDNWEISVMLHDNHIRFLQINPEEIYISLLSNFCDYAEWI